MSELETVCYNIRSFFRESPHLDTCPCCCNPLQKKDIPNSPGGLAFRASATIPMVDTYLYTCRQCGWWAIREVRTDCELCDGCADYLITVRNWPISHPSEQATAPTSDQPDWEKVLNNQACWMDCRQLTPTLATFFFGHQEAKQKKK